MKHKTITTDKATLLVVDTENIDKNEDGYWLPNNEGGYMHIPFNQYQLLGRLPDITENQASELVDSYEVSHNLDLTATLAFKDYNNGISEDENVDYEYWDEYPFDSPLDSISSLLQDNEVYFDNPLGKLHPTHPAYTGECITVKEWLEKCKKWEEAQSKVWDKERCYLFIKVD